MKVLVTGSGGREHALVWKIAQSPLVNKVYCAPGNPGTSMVGENIPIDPLDISNLIDFVQKNQVDLTVVGPENPLVAGIVDSFNNKGLKIFGPSKKAAQLEGSKSFAKDLMQKYAIPTAEYRTFESSIVAQDYLKTGAKYPLVLKASGLAAGKGVLICPTDEVALDGAKTIMEEKAFGSAGDQMIIEEFLDGEEVSIFALCDGTNYLLLSPAQDHKKVFDEDKGKNTGGMGAYAPAPIATTDFIEHIKSLIVEPTIKAMQEENTPYKGLLYFGLIVTKEGPKVLEYNCRFGDPETEVILPLMQTDLVPLLLATIEGKLNEYCVNLHPGFAFDVVLASGGYPDKYDKGKIISGLESLDTNVLVFHAGTKLEKSDIVTSGGRVLNMVARGDNFYEVRDHLYQNICKVSFDGIHYRKDIGYRAERYLKL